MAACNLPPQVLFTRRAGSYPAAVPDGKERPKDRLRGRLDAEPAPRSSLRVTNSPFARIYLPREVVYDLTSTIIFGIGVSLIAPVAAYFILRSGGQGLRELASDGSLILAPTTLVAASLPQSFPRDISSNPIQLLVFGVGVLFCLLGAAMYGAVVIDTHLHAAKMSGDYVTHFSQMFWPAALPLAIAPILVRPIPSRTRRRSRAFTQ